MSFFDSIGSIFNKPQGGRILADSPQATKSQKSDSDSGLGGLLDLATNLFKGVGGLGIGTLINKALDSFGLPSIVGDIAGTVADALSGNIPGAISNGIQALQSLASENSEGSSSPHDSCKSRSGTSGSTGSTVNFPDFLPFARDTANILG